MGYDGYDYEIFIYSKGTITQLTHDYVDDMYPQVNSKGQIIWQGYDRNDDHYHINGYLYPYPRGILTWITGQGLDDLYPQINSKGQIVWQGFDGNDREIFLYSNGIITQITDNEYDDLINIKH